MDNDNSEWRRVLYQKEIQITGEVEGRKFRSDQAVFLEFMNELLHIVFV
jgi:hypothetical protein